MRYRDKPSVLSKCAECQDETDEIEKSLLEDSVGEKDGSRLMREVSTPVLF